MANSSQFILLGESKNRRSRFIDVFSYYTQNSQHNEVQRMVEPLPYSKLKSAENILLFEDAKDIGDEQLLCIIYKFMDGESYIFTFNDYSHNNVTGNIYNHVLPFQALAGIIVVLDYNRRNLADLYESFTTDIQSVLPPELRGSLIYIFINCESDSTKYISHLGRLNQQKELSANWFCFQSISNTGEEFQANKNEFDKLMNYMIDLPLHVVSGCETEDGRKTIFFSCDKDTTDELAEVPVTEEHSLLDNQLVNRSYFSRRSIIIYSILFLGAPIILILVTLYENGFI